MNRPKRPAFSPARKKPSGPPRPAATEGGGPPRRRSPLDIVPHNEDLQLKVLGSGGGDRIALAAMANPMEMVVIHGFSREVEDAFQKFHGRADDFWKNHPHLLDTVRKLDEVLAGIQARKSGS